MISLGRGDSLFPSSLLPIKPLVHALYSKGVYSPEWFSRSIAVVGSRKITSYGKQVIEKLIPPLVDAGVTIISGFMYGVDQEAHQACLDCGGKTIAVLGWGIDWKVGESDRKLYTAIEEKGLLVSEYEGTKRPLLWMFPQRNRIVAGLSQAVLVIEAGKASGSLITANLATSLHKPLFATPGPITSSVAMGTNTVIQSGAAQMVISASDILTSMGWEGDSLLTDKKMSTKETLLELLLQEPLTADEIAVRCKWTVEKVGVKLSLLQLQEKITEKDGKYFAKQKRNSI